MKLWTSCFWTHMTRPQTVSIAWKTPAFYKGPSYPKLAPPKELIWAYKNNEIDWDTYTVIYNSAVLMSRTPDEIRRDLLDGTVLLCWERVGVGNCHRHLVAAWLRENGIECEEVSFG